MFCEIELGSSTPLGILISFYHGDVTLTASLGSSAQSSPHQVVYLCNYTVLTFITSSRTSIVKYERVAFFIFYIINLALFN